MRTLIALILAGGGGTRLWPYSRNELPKQFLSFEEERTLLQKTALRMAKSPFVERIAVSTQKEYAPHVRRQLEEVGLDALICIEPERKNTAPALVYALKCLEEAGAFTKSSLVLVLPSDHWMEPESIFLDALEQTMESAAGGKIVTYGIKPSRPETGYGYLLMGKKEDSATYAVRQFIEKPPLEKAALLALKPDAYWNSGIFQFAPSVFWEEMGKWAPLLGEQAAASLKDIEEAYSRFPSLSIDYALMEKSSRLVVCPLPVTWSDIGSWDSLYDALEKDENQNVLRGDVHVTESHGSLLLSTGRTVVALGVENLLLIETADRILVAKRGESQKVRQAVEQAESVLK